MLCALKVFPGVSEVSPERVAKEAEHQEFQGSDNSSECPDELYNLTKLAEVAAAAGQILENRHLSVTPNSTSDEEPSYTYTHKLFDKSSRTPRTHVLKVSQVTFGIVFVNEVIKKKMLLFPLLC